jgi:hypothetical protein
MQNKVKSFIINLEHFVHLHGNGLEISANFLQMSSHAHPTTFPLTVLDYNISPCL